MIKGSKCVTVKFTFILDALCGSWCMWCFAIWMCVCCDIFYDSFYSFFFIKFSLFFNVCLWLTVFVRVSVMAFVVALFSGFVTAFAVTGAAMASFLVVFGLRVRSVPFPQQCEPGLEPTLWLGLLLGLELWPCLCFVL